MPVFYNKTPMPESIYMAVAILNSLKYMNF